MLYATSVNASVTYYVVPDDHTNSSSNTLCYYMNNSERYFSSNVHLQFLPGKYYLDRHLFVRKVSNISFSGGAANNTIIFCNHSKGLVFKNSKNININCLTIKNCGYLYSESKHITESPGILFLFKCSDVVIQSSVFECDHKQCGLVISDASGNSTINNVRSGQLLLIQTHTISDVVVEISDYEQSACCINDTAIKLIINQHSYTVTVALLHIKLNVYKPISIYCSSCEGQNIITVKEVQLLGTVFSHHVIDITLYHCEASYNIQFGNRFLFTDCHISNISGTGKIFNVQASISAGYAVVQISNSSFRYIKSDLILHTQFDTQITIYDRNTVVTIQNTTFSMIRSNNAVILVKEADIKLVGPLTFTRIVSYSIILHTSSQDLQFNNCIQFSYNQIYYGIVAQNILLDVNTTLDIMANYFTAFFYARRKLLQRDDIYYCALQYVETHHQTYYFKSREQYLNKLYQRYSVIVKDNIGIRLFHHPFATSHCEWIDNSVYKYSDPHEINKHVIKYCNNSFEAIEIVETICYCTDDQHYNCTVDELGPVYPGQTYTLNLIISNTLTLESLAVVSIDDRPSRACNNRNMKYDFKLFQNACTTVDYNILYDNIGKSCELYLQGTAGMQIAAVTHKFQFWYAFRIKILPCPLGFKYFKITQMCQCDPVLTMVSSCNIEDQTIIRPANSWIVGTTSEHDHYTYQVSPQCPFDYCLPHSSHLNLSSPDYQCEFHRTGVLCGRCKEGLSTVFGTSLCMHCTNYYLFLILPITLGGIVVIIFLFVSNFTVANGSINVIIFYANIASINGPVLFNNYKRTKYVYILISLLNLDLGIETCFYNGMDDYAKMWLQLIFPIYLIFIATLLIITSRYSTRIQRLTARRALPVLATLFLLSYTKILRTVSSVLFSYSTITSLPNKTTTLVWSVDTETKLFGLKFSCLFVVCLVLFLILLPFNIILLFTKTLSYFKFINHFKPILDAYQGPYKVRFYYWTGIQLLLRAVFYGISALDRNTNMMIGIIILGAMECIHGIHLPFKSNSKNYLEISLLFNLNILFAISMYTASNSIAVNTLVSLFLGQFIIFILHGLMLYSKLKLSLMSLTKLLSKYFNYKQSTSTVRMELCNTPREVMYNYKEFREPIIEQD